MPSAALTHWRNDRLPRLNDVEAHIKRDFNRFGFLLDLQVTNAGQITDLGHLNAWRNKAAHQGTKPLAGGVAAALTLPLLQAWKSSCDGLAVSLDGKMQVELTLMTGAAPW